MTTPNNPVPDQTLPEQQGPDHDDTDSAAGSGGIPGADAGGPGVEVGLSEGESTFEPEEDPEGHQG